MLNFLTSDFPNDEYSNTLDTIHDALLTMNRITILDRIHQPYINQANQLFFITLIGFTMLVMVLLIVLSIIQLVREDEIDFFESAIKNCVKMVFDTQGEDWTELSFLLGEPINQIVFIFQEDDDSFSNLRVISNNYDFIITHESYSWLLRKVIKYVRNTTHPIITFDFLDIDVFFKIDEAIIKLKEAK